MTFWGCLCFHLRWNTGHLFLDCLWNAYPSSFLNVDGWSISETIPEWTSFRFGDVLWICDGRDTCLWTYFEWKLLFVVRQLWANPGWVRKPWTDVCTSSFFKLSLLGSRIHRGEVLVSHVFAIKGTASTIQLTFLLFIGPDAFLNINYWRIDEKFVETTKKRADLDLSPSQQIKILSASPLPVYWLKGMRLS